MAVPSKKSKQSDLFFNQKVIFEDALNQLEKQILDQNGFWQSLRKALQEMKTIAQANGSVYFLHRVQKLEALTEKLYLKKAYKKEEFDLFYTVLEKISNQDRIEFLDSAIKNQLGKVAASLQTTVVPTRQKGHSRQDAELTENESYIAYRLDTLRFLLPKYPFRILKELKAYRSKMMIGDREVPLFPGPGFADFHAKELGPGPKIQKKVLLLMKSELDWEAFYFDELEEEWLVPRGTMEAKLDLKNKSNQRIWGTIRKKGKTYHLVKVPLPR